MGEKKSYPLRIDPDVYDAIKRWADDELRSVNGQIEYLLRDAVQKRKGVRGQPEAQGGASRKRGSS